MGTGEIGCPGVLVATVFGFRVGGCEVVGGLGSASGRVPRID